LRSKSAQVASSLDALDGLLEDVDFDVHVTPLDFGETLPTDFGSRSPFFEVSLALPAGEYV
jgi:hypothetical protein